MEKFSGQKAALAAAANGTFAGDACMKATTSDVPMTEAGELKDTFKLLLRGV